VPGYEASTFHGIGAPVNVPDDIIDKLNREISAGLADPTLKARFANLGAEPMAKSPAKIGKFIAEETEKWPRWLSSLEPMPTDPAARDAIFHISHYGNLPNVRDGSILRHHQNGSLTV
jgi:hypothetical protein